MKVALDKLTVTRLELDLPERCPTCGHDLREEDGLREDQYVGSDQRGRLTDEGPEIAGQYENAIAPTWVVAYACGECGEVLVNSDEPTATQAAAQAFVWESALWCRPCTRRLMASLLSPDRAADPTSDDPSEWPQPSRVAGACEGCAAKVNQSEDQESSSTADALHPG
jgi:hypothetical protein